MGFSFLTHSVTQLTPERTLVILTYEVGAFIDTLGKSRDFGRTELSDIVSMTRMFCEQVGVDYDALLEPFDPIGRFNVELILKLAVSLGKLAQSYHYTNMFGSSLHHDDLPTSLREFIHTCRRCCFSLRWDYFDIQDMGERKYMERMAHIKQDGRKEVLKEVTPNAD